MGASHDSQIFNHLKTKVMKILKPTTPEQVRQMGDEIFQAIASVCKEYNEQVLNPVKEKQDDIQH